jgi:hypothetical protein
VELDREIRFLIPTPTPPPSFVCHVPIAVFVKRFILFVLVIAQIRNFFAGKEQVALVPQLPPKGNKLFTNHKDPAFIEVGAASRVVLLSCLPFDIILYEMSHHILSVQAR